MPSKVGKLAARFEQSVDINDTQSSKPILPKSTTTRPEPLPNFTKRQTSPANDSNEFSFSKPKNEIRLLRSDFIGKKAELAASKNEPPVVIVVPRNESIPSPVSKKESIPEHVSIPVSAPPLTTSPRNLTNGFDFSDTKEKPVEKIKQNNDNINTQTNNTEMSPVVLTLNDGDDINKSEAYDNSDTFPETAITPALKTITPTPEIVSPIPTHSQNQLNSIAMKSDTGVTQALDDILNSSMDFDSESEGENENENENNQESKQEPKLEQPQPQPQSLPPAFDSFPQASFQDIEISPSPPPAPVDTLNHPHVLTKHVSSSSLPRNITSASPASPVPAVPDIPFDTFDEYVADEPTPPPTSSSSSSDRTNVGHLSEAFKFPGSPKPLQSSKFTNITRAARSGSIASSSATFGYNKNVNNYTNNPTAPNASNSYVTTFEAPTNLSEYPNPVSNGLRDKINRFETNNYGYSQTNSSIPLSLNSRGLNIHTEPNNHSVKLSPIEVDNVVSKNKGSDNIIFGVCVVGFHHIRGPEVEYWVDNNGGNNRNRLKLWPYLPFQSLPDGSHSQKESFCSFSLLYDTKNKTAPIAVPTRDKAGNVVENVSDMENVITLFGLSCNRQLKSTDLKERPADVTRSTVQKSVVVIARKPIFGAIREKLAVITRAYFDQGNFHDRSLIDSLYENLDQMFTNKLDESNIYVGMSVRKLVFQLRSKVLVLLKALLLEQKVFFFGNNTEMLCASQFALLSLVPNLMNSLDDCGSPLLNSYESKLKKPNSLKTSDRNSLLNYMGLPLQLFSKGGMFTAYLPLQQMNEIKAPETKHFLAGSTNSMLLMPQNRVADIIVYVDSDNVEIINTNLNSALSLSSADKKWMDMIVKAVVDTWDPEDPGRPKGLGFHGSEDFVRQQFEDYLKSLVSAVKYDMYLTKVSQRNKQPLAGKVIEGSSIKNFNSSWIKEWKNTNNYRIFSKFTDDELFDIVEPKHVAFTMTGAGEGNNGGSSEDNVATMVTKAWGSLWWGQEEGTSANSSSNNSNSNYNNSRNNTNSTYPNHKTASAGENADDGFQDTSLYDYVPPNRGNGSRAGGYIGKRTRSTTNTSTTNSTTTSNSTVSGTRTMGMVNGNEGGIGTGGGSGAGSPLTPSSNFQDSSSLKSSKSTTSSFFNGWLWGGSKEKDSNGNDNGMVKSP